MDLHRHIEYWKEESDDDWAAAGIWIEESRNLHWALFIMHLSLEKALKALYVKTRGAVPPRSHNLVYLAREADLMTSEIQEDLLDHANKFNLEARYPEYQRQLKRLATPEFTRDYWNRLGEMRIWILDKT